MSLIVYLVVSGLIAWLNFSLATKRNRSAVGWAIGGVVFGLLSTVLLLVLGNSVTKDA